MAVAQVVETDASEVVILQELLEVPAELFRTDNVSHWVNTYAVLPFATVGLFEHIAVVIFHGHPRASVYWLALSVDIGVDNGGVKS